MRLKKIVFFFPVALFFFQCSLVGIQFHPKTPEKPGKYPTFTAAQKLLAQQTKKRTCFDVKYYKLDLKIDADKKTIGGNVTMTSVLLKKQDTIQIDLYKNLKVDSIVYNTKKINFSRVEGAIFIALPNSIRAGNLFTLTISYNGKPNPAKKAPWDGGLVWKKDKQGNPWAGVACESEGASLWWPNKDDVSDEADSTDIYLNVPEILSVVSNGSYKCTKLKEQNTKTVHWHVSYPINNYNVTFYLGNYTLIADTFVSRQSRDTIKFSYYILPEHSAVAKSHFQQVKQQIDFYERAFGNYPWPKDGYKLIESPYEGMEHQSAIAYGNKFKNDGNGFDYILLHETAHEWWGNSVTSADLSDVWLQEGFATYAEALYVEDTKGQAAYLNYLYWYRITIMNKLPVVKQTGLRYFPAKDGDVYTKGAWILHSLRNTIKNDSVFFDILKTFRTENNCKQIFTNAFVDIVNKKTQSDYNWFFQQYLYRRDVPLLEFYKDANYFYYRWKDVNDDFNKLPVEVNFGSKKEIIYPNQSIQKIKVDASYGTDISFSDHYVYFGTKKNKQLVALKNLK